MTGRGWLGALAVAVCIVGGVACSSEDGTELPAPPPTSTTTTTAAIDYSEVALAPITPGKPPPVTRPPGPGKASIAGKVLDDRGTPVPGALVRAAYYFDPAKPEIIEALSGPDGGYRFDRLYGGRWRIRAWLPPALATLEQPSFFLGALEQKVVDLKVKVVEEFEVTTKMAPDPPLVGWLAELAVRVVSQTVDPEGRVTRTPLTGALVQLTSATGWKLAGDSERIQTSDADGTVRWTMTCSGEAAFPAMVTTLGRDFPFTLPSCLSPASTTTSTTVDPASTTTTKPRPRTTTTTRPRTTSSTRSGVQPR